ncbi:hypothetical protein ACFL6S_08090 [Candidatus Poribacteria bacterium]
MIRKNSSSVPSDYREFIGSRLGSYLRGDKCARCFLPGDFRSIELDNQGSCNYCHDYEALSSLIDTPQRHQEFIKILEEAQRKAGTSYDCIICLSGGKDSTYLLDLLRGEYNLNIICVTIDTGFLSELARQNIRKTIDKLQVDHVFLKAPTEIIDIYRYGFTTPSDLGIERDVCDLCDGIIRKETAQFAIDNDIPLIVDGLDPFQLIDAGLNKPVPGIEDPLSCWPERLKEANLFGELYKLENFSNELIPFELYPFLYLPYDDKLIRQRIEEKDIIVNSDPDLTNCRFVYLLDFLDLVRKGFPAYAHTISSIMRGGKLSPQAGRRWMQRAFLEYAEGLYNDQVLDALNALGLSLETLITEL